VLETSTLEDMTFVPRAGGCVEYTLGQDEGYCNWVMNLGNEISRMGDIPFIFMPQAHLWYRKGEVRREPTNEELEMMSNVALTYGARGLQHFYFPSQVPYVLDTLCPSYSRGILDTNFQLRTLNVYHQAKDKW